MLFIEQLTHLIRKDRTRRQCDGDYYFDKKAIRHVWAKVWFGTLTPEKLLHPNISKQPSLGDLAQNPAHQLGIFERELIFFLELSLLYAGKDPVSTNTLKGFLSFLMQGQAWRPTSSDARQLSRDVTRWVNERLAELYFRLLASYWRHTKQPLPSKLDDIANLISDAEAFEILRSSYEIKQPGLNQLIMSLAYRECACPIPTRWGINRRLLGITIESFPSIEKLFFARRRSDSKWLRNFLAGNPSGNLVDQSIVTDTANAASGLGRNLNFKENGTFPVTLLLILLMESVINKGPFDIMPPFRIDELGAVPDVAGLHSTLISHTVAPGDFINKAEADTTAAHTKRIITAKEVRKKGGTRYVAPISHEDLPPVTGLQTYFTGTPMDLRFLAHNDGCDEIKLLTDATRIILDFEAYEFPASTTIAINIPSTLWNAIEIASLTFVYWFINSDLPRIQIPHRQVPLPTINGCTLYIHLDQTFISVASECSPAFFLSGRTEITVGAHLLDGVLQVYLLLT